MEEKKQLIINADDFGISESVNESVFDSYTNGILTSTSIMSNGPAFAHAIKLLEKMQNLSVGIHLNVIEFTTLNKKISPKSLLYDQTGKYNNGFISLLCKSFNKNFLEEIEADFRLQIEKTLSQTKVDHIDSHVHVHAIPNIFKIVCKLAQEYGIDNIRTQYEHPYLANDIKKYFSIKYPINWIKLILLNSFTVINKKYLSKTDLKTNNNFIGVNYTGYMDINTLEPALKKVQNRTEAALHPSTDKNKHFLYQEYLTLTNQDIKQKIKNSDITLINFLEEEKL